ncbi:hypothetical protein GZ77_02595 [Endozoicomonas montiporae]|uniref:Metal-binding protein n=2 Tax=Endozoicomonas montiporae TaxID=1027273 RepID=A0A081NAQ8_9GAMM|nr:YecH family metal-binding protein [Endozoicomonas montiporae]AMO56775.1 putative metal-binding protein YecH [Endozoicomonas montiporae CL-33]KEQ15531.1 hypothetical protein GZ77_02595 [Endozoicomonas montiporae]
MQDSIHGHNVLNLIREHNQPVNIDELLTAISQHFGTESRFHTCSAEGLSADQLVELFLAKGKLVLENEQIHFVGCRCKH